MFTDNPVRDAEEYFDRLEQKQEEREHKECGYCHGPIYRGDDEYNGDIYYPVDGMDICSECIGSYLRKIRREYL